MTNAVVACSLLFLKSTFSSICIVIWPKNAISSVHLVGPLHELVNYRRQAPGKQLHSICIWMQRIRHEFWVYLHSRHKDWISTFQVHNEAIMKGSRRAFQRSRTEWRSGFTSLTIPPLEVRTVEGCMPVQLALKTCWCKSSQHPRGTQVNKGVYSPSRQAAKQGRSLGMSLRHPGQQSL